MRQGSSGWTSRLVALTAMLVLSVGASACGSDDDGSAGDAEQAAGTATAQQERGMTRSGGDPDGTPDQRIRANYDALVDAIYASDATAACDSLTPGARKRLGDAMGCEKRLKVYFENEGQGLIDDRPRAIKVRIRGDRALVRAKTKESDPYSIPFVEVGGEWKADGGFETAGL